MYWDLDKKGELDLEGGHSSNNKEADCSNN
jgi:hypothetical protein